jgi:hypothetical protein
VLILANGAFKCGSGWQNSILRRLVPSEPITEAFQNPEWRNPSFDPDRLPDLLGTGEHVDRDFVSKNHIQDPELARIPINDPHVRVCNLTRDLRDVLVSAYYHDQRQGRDVGRDITDYYWAPGHGRIDMVINHHRFWASRRIHQLLRSAARQLQRRGPSAGGISRRSVG